MRETTTPAHQPDPDAVTSDPWEVEDIISAAATPVLDVTARALTVAGW
jgi:hypothetical protein